jgi:hypothetical protein
MYALTYRNQLRSTEASLPVRSGCSLRRRSLFGELLRHGSLGPCRGDQGASAAGIQRDEAGRRQAPQLTVNTSGRTPELNKGRRVVVRSVPQARAPRCAPTLAKAVSLDPWRRVLQRGRAVSFGFSQISESPGSALIWQSRFDLLTIGLPQSGDTQRQLTAPSTSRGRPSIS